MENNEKVKAALELEECAAEITKKRFLIGFDGAIDEIIHVVSTRQTQDKFSRIQSIDELGKRISAASGKSTNLELFPVHKKIGGNCPLMSMASAGMGSQVTSIGLLGESEIDPVFKPLQEKCEVYTLGEPAHTDALEFNDGKIMMGKLALLNVVNWKQICDVIGEKKFLEILHGNDLVAITNWTMLLNLPEIIDHIIEGSDADSSQYFFFDLTDPEKRLKSEISEVLRQIQTLNKKSHSILGVNLSEAEQIAALLGISQHAHDGLEGLTTFSKSLQTELGIHGVVIHSVKYAGASVAGENTAVEGPFCPNPKITTGAGDHFNGGFCSALMGGASLKSALYAGVGVSGWYVRHGGTSPSFKNVIELLNSWASGTLDKEVSAESTSA